jgi:hypothetical protein
VSNVAYQVTNFAYQGSGEFVYQGGVGVTVVQPAGGTSRKKRFKKIKRYSEVVEPVPELVLEIPLPELIEPQWSLDQVLKDMRKAEFDIIEEEEEDGALVVTLMAKLLH